MSKEEAQSIVDGRWSSFLAFLQGRVDDRAFLMEGMRHKAACETLGLDPETEHNKAKIKAMSMVQHD